MTKTLLYLGLGVGAGLLTSEMIRRAREREYEAPPESPAISDSTTDVHFRFLGVPVNLQLPTPEFVKKIREDGGILIQL